jgi:hypothetical protein
MLSTVPTVDWALLGSGEFNKGWDLWQPLDCSLSADASTCRQETRFLIIIIIIIIIIMIIIIIIIINNKQYITSGHCFSSFFFMSPAWGPPRRPVCIDKRPICCACPERPAT